MNFVRPASPRLATQRTVSGLLMAQQLVHIKPTKPLELENLLLQPTRSCFFVDGGYLKNQHRAILDHCVEPDVARLHRAVVEKSMPRLLRVSASHTATAPH